MPSTAGEATAVAGAGPPRLRAIPSGGGALAAYDLALAFLSSPPEASLSFEVALGQMGCGPFLSSLITGLCRYGPPDRMAGPKKLGIPCLGIREPATHACMHAAERTFARGLALIYIV